MRWLVIAAAACYAEEQPRTEVTVDASGNTQTRQVPGDAKISQGDMISRSRRMGCVDTADDCASMARSNLTGCAENPRLLQQCASTCGTCQYRSLVDEATVCADTNEACESWAAAGECEANPRYMLQACTTSCKTCEAKQNGCQRKATTPALLPPNDMDAMFERALTYTEYSPTALSRPPEGPWVMQFENLVSVDEAAAMIAACPNLERSLAGDALSPVRTSTQCWCDTSNGCMGADAVRTLTERMLNISMVPYNNAEYFQVLKYEKGQFYKVHHDQQSAHWTPQGVRLYTFFVYLSDVEAGGGTRFTDIGVTVKPKLGRAILWPSVYGSDLTTSDKRTNHEALPVEKGVKYAANLWQHLYDFKTPSQEGLCVFLGKNSNHQ